MNIRSWFGAEVRYDSSTLFNQALDRLLVLYAEATKRYFDIHPTSTIQEIVELSKSVEQPVGKILFRDWLDQKGIKQLKSISSVTEVNEQEDVISRLEYEIYILSQELQCDDIEEIRSILISIANHWFEKINKLKKVLISSFSFLISEMKKHISPQEPAVQMPVPVLLCNYK